MPLLKFKDVTTLSFLVIFEMQSANSCTKFRFIGTTKFLSFYSNLRIICPLVIF